MYISVHMQVLYVCVYIYIHMYFFKELKNKCPPPIYIYVYVPTTCLIIPLWRSYVHPVSHWLNDTWIAMV